MADREVSVASGASPRNYTDRFGATELKARIEAFWGQKGFDVQVMLIEGAFTPALRAARIDVRSDLINGLPRAACAGIIANQKSAT